MPYTMSDKRIEEVIRTPEAQRYNLTAAEVEDICLAEWPEGDEHQAWLDTATPEAIATWATDIVVNVREDNRYKREQQGYQD